MKSPKVLTNVTKVFLMCEHDMCIIHGKYPVCTWDLLCCYCHL